MATERISNSSNTYLARGVTKAIDPNMSCAAHVCFDVVDIETTWSDLLAAGAVPQGEITLVDNGPVQGLKAATSAIPNGIIIELVAIPRPIEQGR